MSSVSVSTSVQTRTVTGSDGKKKTFTVKEERRIVNGKEEVTRTEFEGTPEDAQKAIGNGEAAKKNSFFSDMKERFANFSTTKGPDLSLTNRNDVPAVTKEQSKSEFLDEGLAVHNRYRSKHGVAPLKLSKDLCSVAQDWAEHLAARNCLQHRPDGKYGENVYSGYKSHGVTTAAEVVDSWYSEIKDYDFNRHSSRGGAVGHFTQVVWKDSSFLGMGTAKSSNGAVYVVGNYDPPGNFIGREAANVFPTK